MVFVYDGWTLYQHEKEFLNGEVKTIYFFSKRQPRFNAEPCELPAGFKVGQNKRTGLPYLKKE